MSDKAFKKIYQSSMNTDGLDLSDPQYVKSIVRDVSERIPDDTLRMSRAFPAFKVLFIEEGKEAWGVMDDLYGWNSVQSIEIHKSREMASDVAVVSVTNLRGKLDDKNFKDKDHSQGARENLGARFDHGKFDKTFLLPGTKVKILMGYSPDMSELENVFTGKVATVEHGDVVTFVAQGYGMELLEDKGYDYEENLRRNWKADPVNLMSSLMMSREIRNFGIWGPQNPSSGEIWGRQATGALVSWLNRPQDDNIYLHKNMSRSFLRGKAWKEHFKLYRSNTWDTMQEIATRFPGYIASVVPYDNRATFFFGLPDQPYWYTDGRGYEKEEETWKKSGSRIRLSGVRKGFKGPGRVGDNLHPRKKVFRGYHFKDSYHHIVSNNIKISFDDFYNRIIIQFHEKKVLDQYAKTQKEVEKLLKKRSELLKKGRAAQKDIRDIDAKVEKMQRSAVKRVKTQNFTLVADDTIDEEYYRTKVIFEKNAASWWDASEYALGHLWREMKKLYSGELLILGDPKIKPYDRVYIYDSYTDMYGPIEVREVIHEFSKDTGFVTTVIPDLVVHVNDPLSIISLIVGHNFFTALSLAGIKKIAFATFAWKATVVAFTVLAGILGTLMFGKMGYNLRRREPISVTPLLYDGKPYIAGLEGMRRENLFVWSGNRIVKWFKDAAEGIGAIFDRRIGI